MEPGDLNKRVEHLDDQINHLEAALKPFYKNALAASTGKLPLLDRAKVYVLMVYAIESIIFSYVGLNSLNAKEHPVFRELTRVKQYFEKIKAAETPPRPPNMRLDKEAASRFIKSALAMPRARQIPDQEKRAKSLQDHAPDTFSKRKAGDASDEPIESQVGEIIPTGLGELQPELADTSAVSVPDESKRKKKRRKRGEVDASVG